LKRIEDRLGSLIASKITSLDIVELIEHSAVPWNESRMLLTTARMVFKHAAGRRLVSANPCVGIELTALLGKRPTVKRRLMLSADEMRELFAADMNAENALTVRVLLATAVRSGELSMAKWKDFDFGQDVWSIPTTKTGPGMQIPLTGLVRQWFLELKVLAGGSAFVLPFRGDYRNTSGHGGRPINPNTIGSAIEFCLTEQKPKVRRFTPHDLRSTAKSQMRALGVPRDITEMCLNHKLPGVEGIYDVHTYFEERKLALSKWSDYLGVIETSVPASKTKS
jgi:integrase